MNMSSVVTAESVVEVSASPKLANPSWPTCRPPQGNAASWVITHSGCTNDSNAAMSRAAIASYTARTTSMGVIPESYSAVEEVGALVDEVDGEQQIAIAEDLLR